MSRRLFGTNGIRGVANRELTPELALRVGLAVGAYFGGGRLIVGRDGRFGSLMVQRAVEAGLHSAGSTIYDVGVMPTPAIQYAVKHFGMDGGVIITASHNPPEYVGIKVVASNGVELPREEEVKVEEIFFEERFLRADWRGLGSTHRLSGVLDVYLEAVKSHVDVDAIRRRGFRVVVDPGNGVGALSTPRLLRELGCRVYAINSHIDGSFPGRPPEPRPEYLGGLSNAVRDVGADLGAAHD
ncbi:phosphoglucosamine mutase, partial [archaeon]